MENKFIILTEKELEKFKIYDTEIAAEDVATEIAMKTKDKRVHILMLDGSVISQHIHLCVWE